MGDLQRARGIGVVRSCNTSAILNFGVKMHMKNNDDDTCEPLESRCLIRRGCLQPQVLPLPGKHAPTWNYSALMHSPTRRHLIHTAIMFLVSNAHVQLVQSLACVASTKRWNFEFWELAIEQIALS